jgi:hypothetical protein
MASEPERKDIAHQRNGDRMTADYGQRAALALDRCVPGPNKDKAVARLLNVSVRMAQYLRRGQHWTAGRLTQASATLRGFDQYISAPNIHQRLDAMEAELTELRQHLKESEGEDGQ